MTVFVVISMLCLTQEAPEIPPEEARPAATTQPAEAQPAAPTTQPALTIPELLAAAEKALEFGEWDLADSYYAAVLQQDAFNLEAKLGTGRVLEERGDMSAARSVYMELQRGAGKDDYRVAFGLGRVYTKTLNWRLALRNLEIADRVAPQTEKSKIRTYLALVYRGVGGRSKARQNADDALKLDPKNFDAWEILATLLNEAKEYEQARETVERLVEVARERLIEDPSRPRHVMQLQRALEAKLSVWGGYYGTLCEQDPKGNSLDKILVGRESEAAATVARIIETEIQKSEITRVMSLWGVLPLAERNCELEPGNAQYWMTLGLLYLNTFQPHLAVEAFRKVLEIDPGNAEAQRQIAALGAQSATQPAGASGGTTPEAANPRTP